MPQRMWRDWFAYLGLEHVFAKNLPRAHSRQRLTARVQKKDSFSRSFFQLRTKLAQVDCRGADCFASDGHETLLRTLTENPDQVVLQHHVAYRKGDPFRYSKPRAVRKLQHCAITKC